MQSAMTMQAVSYSGLPLVCTRNICTQLAACGPQPVVRARGVNQDFFQEARIPLAEAVIRRLAWVTCKTVPSEDGRLREFEKHLAYVRQESSLPATLRGEILVQLCRIVDTLPSQWFRAGWKAMVEQFNAEPSEIRAQLRAGMIKANLRNELYGDNSVAFNPDAG